ncbi:MAG: prolipoprotein diacylglyceryl transferase [Acidobacteriia bacterium]|nr:prolipoprotein diacylglyceryl transferase [Terriglobia bacterium]
MRPVLFRVRGFPIYSYPALLYLGLVGGIEGGSIAARAAGIDATRFQLALLLLLLPALIGARLLYVVTHWPVYHQHRCRIWNSKEGGAAQYGGILVVLPLSGLVVPLLHLSWGSFWDAAAFTLLIGMVFGRIGCLLNGCCAGRGSSCALAVPLPNVRGIWAMRLPTQILEAVWAAALLVIAMVIRGQLPFRGALFWVIAAGYAAGRLVLESTRESAAGRFTVHHRVSAGLIVLSLAALLYEWPKF